MFFTYGEETVEIGIIFSKDAESAFRVPRSTRSSSAFSLEKGNLVSNNKLLIDLVHSIWHLVKGAKPKFYAVLVF